MSVKRKQVLDPSAGGWVETYKRLVEIVVPRPIALVSTIDAHGRTNLAPFSFFTVVSSNPPCLAFSPQLAGRTGDKKDTLRNIEAVGEFVVSVVTEDLAEQVNACASALAHGDSEFDHSGLTPVPATRVRPPLVGESPVNLECRLIEIRRYGDGGGAGNLIVGGVELLHVDSTLREAGGEIRHDRLRAVGRMGGNLWVRTADTFPLERP